MARRMPSCSVAVDDPPQTGICDTQVIAALGCLPVPVYRDGVCRGSLARRQGAKAFALRTKEKAITPLPHFPLDKLRHLWSSKSPFLLFAIKSALAAGFSWGVAYSLIGREAASLAVVSALIVVQVTSWQTVRKSIERILGVIIGVSLAILVTHFAGLNTWTITLMIFSAQIVSMFLQNRGQYLATQIPISAAHALNRR